MPNLDHLHKAISSSYFSTQSTTDRYCILNELEKLIKELRQNTVDNLETLSNDVRNNAFERIRCILMDQCFLYEDIITNKISPESTIIDIVNELKLDSLDMIEIVMALEEEFDMSITDEEAESLHDINELLNLVTHNSK